MEYELISIIVPAYGVDKYLAQCLDSIISQTYKNLEILVVDDGSKDKSGIIADEYSRQESRIKVIHKQNGGLSDDRNVGIDNVHGEYVSFVDGDDLISKNYVENLYKTIKNLDTLISACQYQIFKNEKDIRTQYGEEYEKYNSCDAINKMLFRNGITHVACAKLYSKKLFDINPGIDFGSYAEDEGLKRFLPLLNGKYRFPIGILNEDLAVVYYLVEEAGAVGICNAQDYYYRCNPKSITRSKIKEKDFSVFELYRLLSAHLIEAFPELVAGILELKGTIYVKLYKRLVMNNQTEFIDQMNYIQSELIKDTRKLKKTSIRFPTKIRMVVGAKSRSLFKLLCMLENLLGAKS